MKRKNRCARVVLCAQRHPESLYACVRVKGHEMELGGHTNGYGQWWTDSLPCGMKHKYMKGVVCTRPLDHPGPHENAVVRWSR